jgi:hypothetical protein
MAAQEVWQNSHRDRYPKAWDRVEPRDDMNVVWWRGPTVIECGTCGTRIVSVMAYEARREYGIVRDTHRRTAFPRDLGPGQGKKYWLNGYVGGRAGRTSVNFSCSGCHRKYLRLNLRRLGRELFDNHPDRYLLT